MSITSTLFIFLFFPLTLLGYYLIRKELKNLFLLAASILFYALSDPGSLWLLVLSIAVNYVLGLLIGKPAGEDNAENKAGRVLAKIVLIAGLIFNFGLLFYYKYFIFSVKTVNSLFRLDFTLPVIGLPLGISFFTFRTVSYLLDIYWGTSPAQKNPIDAALYISFFPQVTMGPITKYSGFVGQLKDRKFDADDFCDGVKQIVSGLFKKVVFANGLGTMVDYIFSMPNLDRTVVMAWLGIIGYLIQLYYDFGGYSDMAIGMGKLFGFKTPKNFDYPYAAKSIADFWNRWHMTLGTWLKDYIYTPVFRAAQKRKKLTLFGCNVLALFVTWLFSGVWHGAAWHFIFMGLYYFAFIAMERFIEKKQKEKRKKLGLKKQLETRRHAIIAHIYFFIVLVFGQTLFRVNSLGDFFPYVGSMLGLTGNSFVDTVTGYYWARNMVLMVAGGLFCFPIIPTVNKLCDKYVLLYRSRSVMRPVSYAVIAMVSIAFVFTSTYQAFIYFKF